MDIHFQTVQQTHSNTKTHYHHKLQPPKTANLFLKLITAISIILLISIAVVFREQVQNQYLGLIDWFKQNIVLSIITIIVIHVIFTVLFIPGSLLTLLAGYIFVQSMQSMLMGVGVAFIAILVGSNIGALIAFYISRYLFYDWIQIRIQNSARFRLIQKIIMQKQIKTAFILRLCPLVPFNVLNYFFGICDIKTSQMMLANLGMIPGTFLYVLIGGTSSNVQQLIEKGVGNNWYLIVFTIVGTIVLIMFICGMILRARREMKQEINQIELQTDDDINKC